MVGLLCVILVWVGVLYIPDSAGEVCCVDVGLDVEIELEFC